MAKKANGTRRLLSITDYAESRDVSPRTICYHVERGLIELVDGKVNAAQADKAWGAIRRSKYLDRGADPASEASVAKLRKANARLKLERANHEDESERYADRAEALAQYKREAAFMMEAIDAMPERFADDLARQLGIDRDKALAVLTDFAAACRADIGDLDRQMANVVSRA
jgi:hypothetical protein